MASGWQLANVGYAYGTTPALADLSLAIEPGGFYGVVGPNGSGKTTLVDLLIGEKAPSAGEIRFDGRAPAAWRRRDLARRVALVPQEFRVQFGFSVLDVVLMGRHPYLPRFAGPGEEDLAVVERMLDLLDVRHLCARPVTELSGGEKQRVVAARALAQDTPYLLLDEATSSLDISHCLKILRAVRQGVERQGRTVIAVLHDLNLAAAFADRLIVLHRGRLAACGPVAEVLDAELIDRVFGVRALVEREGKTTRVLYNYGEEGRQ
ncbi:MAG: ABC transporter ATP-binding protein [Thermodesulfobacteriota bacterium]